MSTKSNYRPSDLAYYTTWWLSSKSSNSSQTTTMISGRNSIKSEDESTIPEEDINQKELQSNCCIPIKKFRKKKNIH